MRQKTLHLLHDEKTGLQFLHPAYEFEYEQAVFVLNPAPIPDLGKRLAWRAAVQNIDLRRPYPIRNRLRVETPSVRRERLRLRVQPQGAYAMRVYFDARQRFDADLGQPQSRPPAPENKLIAFMRPR